MSVTISQHFRKLSLLGYILFSLKKLYKNSSNEKTCSSVSQLLKILVLLWVLLFKISEGCGGLEKTEDQCHTSS